MSSSTSEMARPLAHGAAGGDVEPQPAACADCATASPSRYYLEGALRRPDSPGAVLAATVSLSVLVSTVIACLMLPLMDGDVWAAAASILPAMCGGLCCGGMLYLDMTHEA